MVTFTFTVVARFDAFTLAEKVFLTKAYETSTLYLGLALFQCFYSLAFVGPVILFAKNAFNFYVSANKT